MNCVIIKLFNELTITWIYIAIGLSACTGVGLSLVLGSYSGHCCFLSGGILLVEAQFLTFNASSSFISNIQALIFRQNLIIIAYETCNFKSQRTEGKKDLTSRLDSLLHIISDSHNYCYHHQHHGQQSTYHS